jgi:hypothetical protein
LVGFTVTATITIMALLIPSSGNWASRVLYLCSILVAVASLATPVLMAQGRARDLQCRQHARQLSQLYATCRAAGLMKQTEQNAEVAVMRFMAARPELLKSGVVLPELTVEEARAAAEHLSVRGGELQIHVVTAVL